MAKQFNISILGFTKGPGSTVCSTLKSQSLSFKKGKSVEYRQAWTIPVMDRLFFVVNDTKVGALERAKYHWRNGGAPARADNSRYGDDYVLVLSQVDKTKPMKTKEFFASLRNPPKDRVIQASTLKSKPREASDNGSLGANVTIMSLQKRGYGGYHREREMVWKDAGKAGDFDVTKTYYYLPLSGFNVVAMEGTSIYNVKTFNEAILDSGIPELENITLYGVRKTDQKWVERQKNWVNIQVHLKKVLETVDSSTITKFAVKELDLDRQFSYNESIVKQLGTNSPFAKFVNMTKGAKELRAVRHHFESLCKAYSSATVDIQSVLEQVKTEYMNVRGRYPLLSNLRGYDINDDAVAEYINLIDAKNESI